MKKLPLLFLLSMSFFSFCFSQQDNTTSKNSIVVMFYNVDNLYDTANDSLVSDEEFLPLGARQWNEDKYNRKINGLAQVISSVNEKGLPALIGLCDVENMKVAGDLVSSQKLKKGRYGIVHFESSDPKGMDAALLYNKEEIELLESKNIPVLQGKDSRDVLCDILFAKCRIKGDRIINVFVNNWPSRIPGTDETEMKRIMAALTLRREVDNILNLDNEAAILIMGDFNDEPTNKSLFQILNATNKIKNPYYRDLYNLMYDIHNINGEGTTLSGENWMMFDQIIVSKSLLTNAGGYYLTPGDGKVFRGGEVMKKDQSSGKPVINSTFAGKNYNGGVSDHLPVYVVLKK